MLLIDGAKYNLWIPENEEQFENMIKEHSKEIFGEDSLYFGIKQKIISRTGVGSIPDGYLIKLDPLAWYLVEAELASHSHEHVVMQLNRFMRGIRNFESQREIVEAMYNEIKSNASMREAIKVKSNSDDPHYFLSNTISQSPRILIIIEQEDPDIQDACEDLKEIPQIIVFQTFVKEGASVETHAHRYEPLHPSMPRPTEAHGEDRKIVTLGAEKREHPRQEQSWEKRLEQANDNVREIVPLLVSRIVELGDVKHRPKWTYYELFKGEFRYNSTFCVLSLKKEKVIISIRTNPATFKDPENWTGTKVYQWYFHYRPGQEKKFTIDSKDQIPYAIELIRHSYELPSE